jgi:hypothetical protein
VASSGQHRSRLSAWPDHEPVGHGSATAAGRELPPVRGRTLQGIGCQNARAAPVFGCRGQGATVPELLKGDGPVNLGIRNA